MSKEQVAPEVHNPQKQYSFFAHTSCEYFPCHKNVPENGFNCLFCYCPLYFLGEACGGGFRINTKGTKICTDCTFPHRRENYEQVLGKLRETIYRDPAS